MSQSQKDSDVQLGQDSEGALGRDDTKKDIEDDEKEDEEDEEDEEKNSDEDSDEDADGDPPTEELADREKRLCSVEAEKAAERNFGEMCPEDLKVTKITFSDFIDKSDCINKVHFKKLSLDVNMVCAFLLLICMNT